MTKQELIAAMRNEVFAGRWCESDFENYDVKYINRCQEPFLWAVRPTGTSLQFIGATSIGEAFSKEQWRMEIFRDKMAPIASITYDWGRDTKYFYWDGLSLVRIQRDEVEEIFLNLWSGEIQRQISLHKEEYDMCDKILPVQTMCNPLKYEAALKKASELGDTSLADCIQRLSRWTRMAVNHVIEIHSDFSDYSFTFCEKVNGEPRICGGIIYSENASDGRHWSMHT